MDTVKLSNIVKQLSREKGRAYVAREMGLSPGTLGTYERGEIKNPSTEVLAAIAKYLGITIDQLMERVSSHPIVKESTNQYKVEKLITFEELAPMVNRLSDFDKKRLVLYTVEAIAV